MSNDALFVFALTGLAAAMMASNRVRFDLVALIVVIALILGDIMSVNDALSGFGSSVVIMVAALLVVGEMLDRTGVAKSVGNLILKHGGSDETRLLVLLMVAAALLGSAMSSTAVVAIFIPIVLKISAETGLDRSGLLLPMSYAALISGMLTLIATPPNLVISDALVEHGYAPLGFFSFFPIGIAILATAVIYFLFIGRRLLGSAASQTDLGQAAKAASVDDMARRFALYERIHVLRVDASLDVLNQDNHLFEGLRILARRRRNSRSSAHPTPYAKGMELRPGDEILVAASTEDITSAVMSPALGLVRTLQDTQGDWLPAVGVADVMIHPEAQNLGKSVVQSEFRNTHDLEVLGILRGGTTLEDPFNARLRTGDRLLVAGPWNKIDQLVDQNHDFVLIGMPGERRDVAPEAGRFGVALCILAMMIGLTLFNIVPVIVAVLLAAIAAVFFRTLSAEQAYGSIHWSSIVLVAGMMPLATALEVTGGSAYVVDLLFSAVGDAGPRTMMSLLFILTAGLGLVLSNTASAVLVAPIAIVAAAALQVSPYPFAITVLMAASAAFSTPVSTPVVTLVVSPGGYRFVDFLKVGLPLTVCVGVITVILTPIVFPF